MKMLWRLFITAMLFVAHTVTAAESESEQDRWYTSALLEYAPCAGKISHRFSTSSPMTPASSGNTRNTH